MSKIKYHVAENWIVVNGVGVSGDTDNHEGVKCFEFDGRDICYVERVNGIGQYEHHPDIYDRAIELFNFHHEAKMSAITAAEAEKDRINAKAAEAERVIVDDNVKGLP